MHGRKNIKVRKECTDVTKLTLNLLTTTIVALPSNARKWQMGFNSAFKGLIVALRKSVRGD
jgi:hypothetical protein